MSAIASSASMIKPGINQSERIWDARLIAEPAAEYETSPLRDRWFNAHRVPRTEKAKDLLKEVINQLTNYEEYKRIRQRARRPRDKEVFEATVSAVICDLMHHHIVAEEGQRIAFSQSNKKLGSKSRYKAVALNKTLPKLIRSLGAPEMQFVEARKGERPYFDRATCSSMVAGKRLVRLMDEYDIGLDDLAVMSKRESIVLKREKKDYWDKGGRAEYDDTNNTLKYRHEMNVINDAIAAADIEFNPFAITSDREIDVSDRHLERIFTQGRFDSGGRLFGGFWQGLRKSERKRGITLDGEAVVALDYSQMAPRILYGLEGLAPPVTDAYTIAGFERQRGGIKKIFNTMLFVRERPSRMPKEIRSQVGDGISIGQVIGAVEAAHWPISRFFFTGCGHWLQFVESEILVDVLLRLHEEGQVGLPCHDAVVVKESTVGIARGIMETVFEEHTGIKGVVVEE